MSLKILAPEFLDHVQITCRSRACLLGVFSDVETPTLPLILTTILSRRRRSIRWNIARMRPGQKTVTKIQSKSSELMKNVPQTSPIPQWVQEARIRNQKKLFHVELFSEHDRVRSSFFTSALWLKGCTSWSWIIQTVILGMGYTEDELYRRSDGKGIQFVKSLNRRNSKT